MLDRLKKRRDFLRVAGRGRKWVTPGLILQTCGMPDANKDTITRMGGLRVGFTVSRKVGGAVARNRVRRRLKAVAEQVLADHATPGRDYVLVGRSATVNRRYDALVQDLEMALQRLDRAAKGAR